MLDSTCFLPQIHKQYESLTAAEKRIADYVLLHPTQTLSLSAQALAQKADTAASAVVRFCKSLGYSGYTDFKVRLAVELSRKQPASYMTGVEPEDDDSQVLEKIMTADIKALQDTLSHMDRKAFAAVAELLSDAPSIHVYGIGTSAGLVGELQHRLMLLGIRVHGYTDTVAMRLSTMNLQPGDVAFGFSHSGRTMAVVDALELAKEAGAATVCLTSYNTSPITRFADRVLTVFCDETKYPIEASTARIAQTAIVDALVAAVSARRFDTAVSRSNLVHDLMEDIRYKKRERK